jgi:hypothetical protein
MNNDILEVYETDADFSMEPRDMKHQGSHPDIAQSKMLLLFYASGYTKDFLIYNRTKGEVAYVCLTAKTKRLRGECQA